jgi:hypothetical protein
MEHAPYIVEDTHLGPLRVMTHRAECPCGWAGVTWITRENAEVDVGRHQAQYAPAPAEPRP